MISSRPLLDHYYTSTRPLLQPLKISVVLHASLVPIILNLYICRSDKPSNKTRGGQSFGTTEGSCNTKTTHQIEQLHSDDSIFKKDNDRTTVQRPDNRTTTGWSFNDQTIVQRPDNRSTTGQSFNERTIVQRPDNRSTTRQSFNDRTIVQRPYNRSTTRQSFDNRAIVQRPDNRSTTRQSFDNQTIVRQRQDDRSTTRPSFNDRTIVHNRTLNKMRKYSQPSADIKDNLNGNRFNPNAIENTHAILCNRGRRISGRIIGTRFKLPISFRWSS